ncbi:MAG: Panacea domain-containing protein [Kofleriaceae bacterium]
MNKLMEASMALLQVTPDQQMNIVVLNKALFYLDLAALRDLGQTVTQQKYFALPMGPVVNKYDRRIVGSLEKAGLAEQITHGGAKPVRVKQRLEAFTSLSSQELELASTISAFASRFSSAMISDLSHKNIGWILASRRAAAGRPAPEIDMRIAMQQVLDCDPWLEEPIGDDLRSAMENAASATTAWA